MIEANGKYALTDDCSKVVKVSVQENGVFLSGITNPMAHDSFWANQKGCDYGLGDMSLLRARCTSFSKDYIYSSSTEPISLVGFVREINELELKDNNDILIHSFNSTAIPVGIILPDEDYECIYKRINNKQNSQSE